MKKTTTAPSVRLGAKISTAKVAAAFSAEEQTPRASLCRLGIGWECDQLSSPTAVSSGMLTRLNVCWLVRCCDENYL